MYKLLLADDEKWIRQGLLEVVNWKDCGIDEVWEAEDGGEALTKARLLQPDIVITDVRMPDIDGLELCSRLKEELPLTKVIIISGYQEFNYARKALSLGVFDYIVKPLNEENILETVRKCIAAITKEHQFQRELDLIKSDLLANSSLLIQEYLMKALKVGIADRELALKKLQELGLNMQALSYYVLIVSIDDYEIMKQSLTIQELESIKLKLLAKTQEWLGNVGTGTALLGENDLIYGCLGLNRILGKPQLEKECESLRRALSTEQPYSNTICISNSASDLSCLPELRQQAEQGLSRKFFLGCDNLIFYESSFTLDVPYRYNTRREEIILEALRLGDRTGLQKNFQEIKAEILDNQRGLTEQDVILICEGLLEYICRNIAQEIPMVHEQFTADKNVLLKKLKFQGSLARLSQLVADQLLQWMTRLDELKGSGKRKITQAVIDYVAAFYNQKITLSSAAKYTHFNASYLCKLFCAEMGESFTRYLMRVRVQNAKELLRNPLLKVYEVGEQVGYSDIKYFNKVFKEIEGMTPAEYRERCLPQKTKILE